MRLVTLAVSLLASLAVAQAPSERPKEKAAPVQHLDFEDDLIRGDRDDPNVIVHLVPKRPGFNSLIKVRTSFDDKLRQSVNEM